MTAIQPPQLILWENRGDWTAALRRFSPQVAKKSQTAATAGAVRQWMRSGGQRLFLLVDLCPAAIADNTAGGDASVAIAARYEVISHHTSRGGAVWLLGCPPHPEIGWLLRQAGAIGHTPYYEQTPALARVLEAWLERTEPDQATREDRLLASVCPFRPPSTNIEIREKTKNAVPHD